MRIFTVRGACAVLISFLLATGVGAAQGTTPRSGDAAFAAGDFDAAASAYAAALAKNPNDSDAQLGLGTVELYRNHLDVARAHLQRALALDPSSHITKARLAAIQERTGSPGDYAIAFAASEARVPLVAIDPLPTLKATIDGAPVTLLIDTGGGGIDVSAALAQKLHLATKVVGEGVFAGGLKAPVSSTRIDRLELPGVTVRGIPGGVIPGGALPGIDGIVGTGFLYHFLATIDYGRGVLVLRPAAASAAFLASAKASGATSTPMWLAGARFMVARARVNAAPDALFMIDTGGPGVGVDLTETALAAAGITPDTSHPQTMRGGGGAAQILSFTAASVTMAGLTRHDLPGIYFPGNARGDILPFAVAGRISHEFFRHTAVTFDFAAMTLVLGPS